MKKGIPPKAILIVILSSALCLAASGVATTGVFIPFSLTTVSILGAILIVSLMLVAFFAGSETAVVSVSKDKIHALSESGDTRARIIQRLLDSPDMMLATVLVGTNLMTTVAGQAGIILAAFAFPGNESMQKLINTVIMTAIILVFCEILPKISYRARADSLALSSARGLQISTFLLRPISSLIARATGIFIHQEQSEETKEEKAEAMRDELVLLATMGNDVTGIPAEQLRMIHNVLNLEERPVEKVMVPLVNIVALPEDATIDELYKEVEESGFTRICVYNERVDNITGYVNVLEVLRAEPGDNSIRPFIRKNICFEPESKHVITLLKELNYEKNQFAFILDEFGGITGMVAIEDLVEEILGEIREENEKDDAQDVRRISRTVFECEGSAEIKALNAQYNIVIPEGDYETIAGYVESVLQKVPEPGESVTTESLNILVTASNERKIENVRIMIKIPQK